MRVLYFYQYFTVPQGSYSTRVYEFARRWVKAGDSVTVVTSVYDRSGIEPKGLISRLEFDGIDVRIVNIRLSNKHGKAFRILTFAAYAVIASCYALFAPADVVVASSGPLTVGLPGLLARHLRRRPLIFEVRDLWPEGAVQLGVLRNPVVITLARKFERLCYRSAATIVALSEGMADWIRSQYGFTNIEVVPNASDNELVARAQPVTDLPEWARGKKLAVYAGALGLIDDCAQILEVARIVQERRLTEIEFVLIGGGKEQTELARLVDEFELRNTHLIGVLPKLQVMSWLKSACCSLFTVKDVPFLATASPNKIFDSFAAGLPVIQTTQGWIKALLDREHCGITVRPNQPAEMADAIALLAREDDLRRSLAENAQRAAMDIFDRTLLSEKMRMILVSASSKLAKRSLSAVSTQEAVLANAAIERDAAEPRSLATGYSSQANR